MLSWRQLKELVNQIPDNALDDDVEFTKEGGEIVFCACEAKLVPYTYKGYQNVHYAIEVE